MAVYFSEQKGSKPTPTRTVFFWPNFWINTMLMALFFQQKGTPMLERRKSCKLKRPLSFSLEFEEKIDLLPKWHCVFQSTFEKLLPKVAK